ncbi:hypothetical protein PIB30_101496 [Stylosanthes scabra]|uniref:Uncharacterized protein n=1 Tax=Stylosanthes scabra TaxID=79078 RepID=A0ABU6VW81_9FABA|nr:hypothetical protein [Stylosanthes scabra]
MLTTSSLSHHKETRSNVKLMTIKERLLGGNPIITEEEEESINKGRKEQKHHHTRVNHHVIRDPFTYNVGSLSPKHFCIIHPTYNAMHHVIHGATSSYIPQMTEAGRYTSQPHVIRGEAHAVQTKL